MGKCQWFFFHVFSSLFFTFFFCFFVCIFSPVASVLLSLSLSNEHIFHAVPLCGRRKIDSKTYYHAKECAQLISTQQFKLSRFEFYAHSFLSFLLDFFLGILIGFFRNFFLKFKIYLQKTSGIFCF